MDQMIKNLIAGGYLKTPSIIDAFKKIDRKDFVPDELKDQAYADYPLPIGFGQTISQPLTVAFMLELLQPKKGNKILDIGSGSGWQTALLSHIVSEGNGNGRVYAVDIIKELAAFGEKNVSRYNFVKKDVAEFHCFNAINGMEEKAPFDRIIAAAAGNEVPENWKKQLTVGGRMVAPIEESIMLVIKKREKTFETKEFPGFSFVPLVK